MVPIRAHFGMSAYTPFYHFEPGITSFKQYSEQLQYYFKTNKVKAVDYKAAFFSICGPKIFTDVKYIFPNQDVEELTYEQIIGKLQKKYDDCTSEITHSCTFWTRRQKKYENTEMFLTEIKQQAERCNFGSFKDRAIRDLLIVGVYNNDLRKRLCHEAILTVAEAEKIILNHENSTNSTSNDYRERRPSERRSSERADSYQREAPSRSRQVDRARSRSGERICTHCLKRGHSADRCFELKNVKHPALMP